MRPLSEKTIPCKSIERPNHIKQQDTIANIIAAQVLGRLLVFPEMVHHIDGNPQNNKNNNLVICKKGYHEVLHQRTRAYQVCGHAHWRKCPYCKKHDSPENMIYKKSSGVYPKNCYYHKDCRNLYRRELYKTQRGGVVRKFTWHIKGGEM